MVLFFVAVSVLTTMESQKRDLEGTIVYFSTDSLLPDLEAEGRIPQLRLVPGEDGIHIQFSQFQEVWARLPQSLLSGVVGESSSRPLSPSLARALNKMEFLVPHGSCRFLRSHPRTFNCDHNKKEGAIASLQRAHRQVQLVTLSSGLHESRFVNLQGNIDEDSFYAVRMGLRFSKDVYHELTLLTQKNLVFTDEPAAINLLAKAQDKPNNLGNKKRLWLNLLEE